MNIEELVDSAVQLVVVMHAGNTDVRPAWLGGDRLHVPIELLPLGRRVRRGDWFHPRGPYARVYGVQG